MSWSKQKPKLIKLLEEVNQLKTQHILSDLYFIKWLKINTISTQVAKTDNKSKVEKFSKIFETEVIKTLAGFRTELKKNVKLSVDSFRKKFKEFLERGEELLKTLPIESYEFYEDAKFLTLLYMTVLDKGVSDNAKRITSQKMALIAKAFEVEAGEKNLEAEQKRLSEALEDRIQGKVLEPPLLETNSEIIEAQDYSVRTLEYPEEELSRPQFQQAEASLQEIIARPQIIPEIPTLPKAEKITFSYPNWFPSPTWNQFITYRYCTNCGKVINPNDRRCIGCQAAF
jgi:hypothetical protein